MSNPLPLADWQAALARQAGEGSWHDVGFRCPACDHVATPADWAATDELGPNQVPLTASAPRRVVTPAPVDLGPGHGAYVELAAPEAQDLGPTPFARLAEAAEQMRLAYNAALAKHGGHNPVLRDLRWAIGHLTLSRDVALDESRSSSLETTGGPDHD